MRLLDSVEMTPECRRRHAWERRQRFGTDHGRRRRDGGNWSYGHQGRRGRRDGHRHGVHEQQGAGAPREEEVVILGT